MTAPNPAWRIRATRDLSITFDTGKSREIPAGTEGTIYAFTVGYPVVVVTFDGENPPFCSPWTSVPADAVEPINPDLLDAACNPQRTQLTREE